MKKGLYGLLVLAALAALALLSAVTLGWNCPVQHFTGVPCPGCGLSRAAVALLRLDFHTAFRYHPMVFVLPPVVLYALFGKKPLLGIKPASVYCYGVRWRSGRQFGCGGL